MRNLREAFSRDAIERIGAAPSIGGKRWNELTLLILARQIDTSAVHPAPFPTDATSDQRFEAWVKAMHSPLPTRPGPQLRIKVNAPDGSVLGVVTLGKGKLTFQASPTRDTISKCLATMPRACSSACMQNLQH